AFGGAELAGGLGVLELQANVACARGLEEVGDVLGIEADGQRLAVVVGLNRVFRLARLRGRSRKLQLALLQLQPDRTRALVSKLRHARNGGAQLFSVQRNALAGVLGKHSFVVGELSGKLTRGQQ